MTLLLTGVLLTGVLSTGVLLTGVLLTGVLLAALAAALACRPRRYAAAAASSVADRSRTSMA